MAAAAGARAARHSLPTRRDASPTRKALVSKRSRPRIIGLVLALSLLAAACGSTTKSTSGGAGGTAGSHLLRIARTIQDMSPDPAVWYGAPANDRQMALYEGLYTSEGSTATIIPQLALSHTVSADGLTYTFKLRPGVKFHDGTAFDAAAAKFSWARAIKINQGASYMLAGVKSMDTPDPLTFVVHLKARDNTFIDYQTSPYGPKFVSPAVVTAHAGKDDAQTWLQTHDAGTGPYTLTSLVNDQAEQMDAFAGYWGPKPYYTTIKTSIIPNVTTQVLQLRQGELDVISTGLTPADLTSFQSDSAFTTKFFPAVWTTFIMLNSNKGIFKDAKLRAAVQQALDPKLITEGARGPAGSVPDQFTPYGMLPAGKAPFSPSHDPSVLTALASKLANKNVTIEHTISIPADAQASNLVQTQLQAAGLNAKVVATNDTTMLGWPGKPNDAPDISVISLNLDTANPASYFQAYLQSKGVLNINSTSIPAGDALIDKAMSATTPAVAESTFEQAATLYMNSATTWPVTNCLSGIVAKKGIVVAHKLLDPYGISFADTKAG
ncbi:MAG: transporter substrate-binding protein [Acidimicrobiales bacterium]|nr:transporter substrate-binding protein [Acidimicrobiales bacterium]